jgi:2-(1,2-epoxy-1,2-dihydrophenyl)acetyl-CoA isomerase
MEANMSVQTERDGGVATIRLDRPQAMNAVDNALGDALRDVLAECGQDPEVRAVVITGNGRAFCSGADLKAGFEPNADGHPDVQRALRERYHPIITGIRTMPKPVITAVNGPAVGIGCSFALAGDLVLAAESAYLMLAFVNIGLVPDGGSSFLIPEKAGLARATEMAMLGERVPAQQALEWGLINRVVPDEALMDEAGALAARLAQGPTRSYAGSKRQLNHWALQRMEQQLEFEAGIQQEMAGSRDFVEGVTAFVEKRAPRFEGR